MRCNTNRSNGRRLYIYWLTYNWRPRSFSPMQNFGKAAIRATKNLTKGYSDTQAKVRDATSNDAWGPTGQDLNLISQLTYNE